MDAGIKAQFGELCQQFGIGRSSELVRLSTHKDKTMSEEIKIVEGKELHFSLEGTGK
ncbi:MAG: hypothetical protein IJR87_10625 [Bacteroidaceae bacterium]|nr:hypothetical protein [Bacteroidaceae bacterium]